MPSRRLDAISDHCPDWLPVRHLGTLLAILGLALVLNPFLPGVHLGEGTVTRYEAARVTYDAETGLTVTDVSDGSEVHGVDLDDDVLCGRGLGIQRRCMIEYGILDGVNISTPSEHAHESQYVYVYLNHTFYEPTVERRGRDTYLALEPETDTDPLANIARTGDFSGPVQAALDGEDVMVYGELELGDDLLRHDGDYYLLYTTGHKRYGSGGSFCASNGDGFCADADTKRWVDTLLTLGSRLLGAALLVGGYSLRDSAEP